MAFRSGCFIHNAKYILIKVFYFGYFGYLFFLKEEISIPNINRQRRSTIFQKKQNKKGK